MARLNLALHAYMYQDAELGQNIKENILACLYTSKIQDDFKVLCTQNLAGIEECKEDFGKMNINRANFLTSENLVEVHLHPTEEGAMALSPNNGSFLANMCMPFLKFELVTKQIDSKQHCSIF